MRFITKPVVPIETEAFKVDQFFIDAYRQLNGPQWMVDCIKEGRVIFISDEIYVNVPGKQVRAHIDDWILYSDSGILSVCPGDKFVAMYEKMEVKEASCV